jgi:hypothetical protein
MHVMTKSNSTSQMFSSVAWYGRFRYSSLLNVLLSRAACVLTAVSPHSAVQAALQLACSVHMNNV